MKNKKKKTKNKKNKNNIKEDSTKKETIQVELMGNVVKKNLKAPIKNFPIDFDGVFCPRCGSGDVIKKGKIYHKYRDPSQRYLCKKDNKRFIIDPNLGFQYPLFVIDEILDLYVQGEDSKAIADRVKKDTKHKGITISISKQSVLNIIRRAYKLLSTFEFDLYHDVTSDEWQIDDIYQKLPKKIYLQQKIKLSELESKKSYNFVHAHITNVLAIKTRYWLAATVTLNRDTAASTTAIYLAWKRAKYKPKIIKSDAWQPYVKAAKSVCPNASIKIKSHKEMITWNSHVESLNRTMRKGPIKKGLCFPRIELLEASAGLTRIWYNFLKIHSSIKKTPAQAAGITVPFKGWDDLLKYAYYLSRYLKFKN